jgi:translocation and assembly module TamB
LSEPPIPPPPHHTLEEVVHQVEEVAHQVEEVVEAIVRRPSFPKIVLAVAVTVFVVLTVLFGGARFGVLLPQGRLLLEASANGLKIGRLGKLRIEGLEGDVWRDFRIRHLTISDNKGVWLDANDLALSWRYAALFFRDLHIDRITARQVTILRRPVLGPNEKSSAMPLSVEVDAIAARLEMKPDFSYRPGVYEVAAKVEQKRGGGGPTGQLAAASLLHLGDHLNLAFDLAKGHPLSLHLNAVEARGGALGGALGLPADQPFGVRIDAGGAMQAGKLTAVVASGATRPVQIDGAWTPQGGSAQGRISLTASTLTRGYADRVGPEVVFDVSGRKAPARTKSKLDLFDLILKASAANLSVTAQGRGNMGQQTLGPDGVALNATSPSLSKLIGGPDMGATSFRGKLTGTLADWRLAGDATIAQVKLGGEYELDRVSGPVEFGWKKGVFDLKGRPTGEGGRGAGYIATLFGARPTAIFEGSRLADGRLLLNSLQGAGYGLTVKATGARSLLGGLTLKGEARASNLAAAKVGANGGATATWNAAQSAPGKPWTLGIDAKGEKLAFGYSELDRLLGGAPRLQAEGSIGGGQISLSKSELTGAFLRASGAGVREADGALKFSLDWSAQGPFEVGPVEVAGKAKGTGAITGTLAAPRVDLLADIDAIDLPRLPLKAAHLVLSFLRRPDGTSGTVALTASSAYGPAAGKSAFSFPVGGVDLTDLAVNAGGVKASGALSLRKGGAASADLQVTATKGAFLDAGMVSGAVKLVEAPGGARARLDFTAKDAAPTGMGVAIAIARVQADGPLAKLPYSVQANGVAEGGKWSLAGRGLLTETSPGYQLGFDGDGRYGRRDLKTTETALLRFGGPERTARLRLAASDGGQIALDGRMNGDAVELKAQLQRLGLGVFDEDLTGKVDAALTLSGQGSRLTGDLDARLDGVRGRGSDPSIGLSGTLKARLAGDELSLDAAVSSAQGLTANADLVLPAEASASPLRIAINRKKPIRGKVFADGEVKPLWDLLVGGERELAGRVKLQGTVGGTLADVRAVGEASVDAGRFSDGGTGLLLRDVTLRAALADNAINITQGTGSDGHGGAVTGTGRVSLLREGASTFRLDLKGFRLIDNELGTAAASGQATIDRNAAGQVRIAGALNIDRADLTARTPNPSGVVGMEVVEVNRPAAMGVMTPDTQRQGPDVAMDVKLTAPRRIFLRGRGLDVEMSLDAHVGGTTSHPTLTGVARVVRGDYDFAGKRFQFDERGVVYLSLSPRDIRLDLTATRDDPSITAAVQIKGTAAKPEISLTSTPVLPNDEVLSQVLFGSSASQLQPLEAAQLASALSALAGGGGFDVVGNLRGFARLDRLALGGGGGSQPGVTVSGGKYLTDDVYLEVTGGGREGPSAQVEWRIGKALSIISKLATSQGDSRLAIRWRKDEH